MVFAVVGMISSGNVIAETIAEFDTTKTLIVDSLTGVGEIARPQICPADSSWIAYEIHDERTIRLIIQNKVSGEKRRIDPSIPMGGERPSDSLSTRMNYDLAWRPGIFKSERWAVYVSDSGGVQDIFLYEVSSGRSYCLLCSGGNRETETTLICGAPIWSPDGKCLTYAAEIKGDIDIYVIRGMDGIIERRARSEAPISPSPLITGEGSQFGAAWCPVPGSGYLAYTEQEKSGERLRIKIRDILTGKTFQFSTIDSAADYFAPTWNAGGTRIAYYRSRGNEGPITRFGGPGDGHIGVGLASVHLLDDSLVISPNYGGSPAGEEIVEVIPNYDRLLGPAWLPGGKYLVVNTYDDPKPTRLRVISIDDWVAGEVGYDYWLRGFVGDRFDFPRDLNIVERNISFSYGRAAKKFLLTGQMVPNLKLVLIPEYIDVSNSRRTWWAGYVGNEQSGPGFLAKVGNFLWSPIAGPDIGVNRGFVPVIGGVALLVLLISHEDGAGPSPSVRDWTPPDFPDAGKARPVFRIAFRI
jgi:hypothetical protein